jgi:hypothetical protein
MLCSVCDFIYGSIENDFVRVRRFRESAKFPDKLQRRCANFVIRRSRLKIMQGFDVSAHEECLTADRADENGFVFLSADSADSRRFFLRLAVRDLRSLWTSAFAAYVSR